MRDSITIETMFLKELIARIVQRQLKSHLGLDLSGFWVEELNISHTEDERVILSLGIKAAVSDKKQVDLLLKKNLMDKE